LIIMQVSHRISRYKFRRNYFNWLEKELSIESKQDWYKVKSSDIVRIPGGRMFLRKYDSSLRRTIVSLIPNWNWKPWMFEEGAPRSYWDKKSNRKSYLIWLSEELNLIDMNSWYRIRTQDITKKKGSRGWLSKYNNSLRSALSELLPLYHWIPWYFESGVPDGFWEEASNTKNYLQWLAGELGITRMTDWYLISTQQVCHLRGATLLNKTQGIRSLLMNYFPDYPWNFLCFQECSRQNLISEPISLTRRDIPRPSSNSGSFHYV